MRSHTIPTESSAKAASHIGGVLLAAALLAPPWRACAGKRLADAAGHRSGGLRRRRQHRCDGAHGEQEAGGGSQAELCRRQSNRRRGALAAAYGARAAPDGYTLFFAASPQIAILPQLQKVNYDPKRDFAPVSIFGTGPFILGMERINPVQNHSGVRRLRQDPQDQLWIKRRRFRCASRRRIVREPRGS
jgi:hypothetical protein